MGEKNSVVWTLVLVGRIGNGKSMTGNTILGRKAFASMTSTYGVTKSCEMQKTVLEDGKIINVIDTPGLFDTSTGIEFIKKDILRCIDLAKDGIHAVLLVFSIKTRFSKEEASILHSMKSLFGSKIVNYIIVVFTGGDELEDDDETLEDYLHECPQPLKDILILCGNRKVLFDNKTKDESKRKAQVQELLSIVSMVVNQNDGKPYTDELSVDMKKREDVVVSLKGYTKQDISSIVRTLVLVGRIGNGKSVTGNTILGRKAFASKANSSGVTKSCELQKTVLEDGQIINVIDTPGLFDGSATIEFIKKDILRCIDLAKDGIHAVLLVFSIKTRFSKEEASILHSLRSLFGSKIVNYTIVVFTGGDVLEDNDETLEDYLHECPQPLKDILILCGNRKVLFDNKTKDESKRKAQVQELLSLVNMVVNKNDGKPYINELSADMKKQEEVISSLKAHAKGDMSKLEEQMQRIHEEMLKRVTNMVEAKLSDTVIRLEQKLVEEEAARKRAEKHAQEAQSKANEEIRKLKESLEDAHEELMNRRRPRVFPCTFM